MTLTACSLLRPMRVVALALPLLANAQVTLPESQLTVTQTIRYERDATTGAVTALTVGDVSHHCTRTTFAYDAHGNRTGTTVQNCAGASGTAVFEARQSQELYTARGESGAGLFPNTQVNALGQEVQLTHHNAFGVVLSQIDPNGLATQYTYDRFGRRTIARAPDGNQIRWTYRYCSSSGLVTPSVSQQIEANCPPQAMSMLVEQPTNSAGVQNGPLRHTFFNAEGKAVRALTQQYADESTVNWSIVSTEYDNLGRVKRQSEPYFEGEPVTWTDYIYDALGRVTEKRKANPYAANGAEVHRLSYNGREITATNPRGHVQKREYDEHNRIIRITDANGAQHSYQYAPNGQLHQTRDALGSVTQVFYDLGGNKARLIAPGMGTWDYAHDPLGQLRQQLSPKGQPMHMSYDRLGRRVQRTEADLISRWYFDATAAGNACGSVTAAGQDRGIGKLCEATSDNGYRKLNTYDTLARLVQTSTTVDGTTVPYVSKVAYNADGHIRRQAWPTGLVVDYVYGSAAATKATLTEMRLASTNEVLWQRGANNARGQFTRVRYGNNAVTLQDFDAATGLLKSATVGTTNADGLFEPGAISEQSYEYNGIGQLTRRTDHISSTREVFTYDPLNRLTQFALLNSALGQTLRTVSYGYNPTGNIVSNSEVGTYTYAAERPHAVSQISGQAGKLLNPSYSYDQHGNITQVTGSNGVTRSHTWTSYDHPLNFELSQDNVTVSWLYGPERQRIRETFTKSGASRTLHILHPDNEGGLYFERERKTAGPGAGSVENRHYLSAEKGTFLLITSSGAIVSNPNISTPATLTNLETRYWHKDHLGSIVASTNGNLTVIERLAYDPFGKRRFTSGQFDQTGTIDAQSTNRGFTGHEHLDELDFVHMNARVYDPDIGRFLSADPTVPNPYNPQAYNRYAYVYNNPLGLIDKNGFEPRGPDGGFVYGEGSASLGSTSDPSGVPGSSLAADGTLKDSHVQKTAQHQQNLGLAPKSEKGSLETVKQGVGKWWEASVAGFKSESPGEAALRILQGLPGEGVVVGGISKVGGALTSFLAKLLSKGDDVAAKGIGAAEREATGFLGRAGNELKNAPYQNVRNEATKINGRDFSGHALDQMQNRGVMPSVVENALSTGTQFSTRAGTTGIYDAVNNVRVIVNSETGRVVTVIRGAP